MEIKTPLRMSQQDCTPCTCISRNFYFWEMLNFFFSYFGGPNLQGWAMLFLAAMGNKGWIILLASEGNLLITGQLSLRDGLCSVWWIMQLSWFWHNCSIIPGTVNTELQETQGREITSPGRITSALCPSWKQRFLLKTYIRSKIKPLSQHNCVHLERE